jgi:hypothetical protein
MRRVTRITKDPNRSTGRRRGTGKYDKNSLPQGHCRRLQTGEVKKVACFRDNVEGFHIDRKCLLLKKTPWPESASELYRPSDRRLSAK